MTLAQDNWSFLYIVLILILTGTQILVAYTLSSSEQPPAGLALFTVYFTAALLVWIIHALRVGTQTMSIDLPGMAAIINNYVLFLAMGQRSEMTHGRLPLGLLCLCAILGSFFLSGESILLLQDLILATLFVAVGIQAVGRCINQHNVGDGIIVVAALLMVTGMPLSHLSLNTTGGNFYSPDLSFGLQSVAHTLVMVGFLSSVVIDFQTRLRRLSTNDSLTGLFNRRGLQDALKLPLALAKREQTQMAAIALEVDHFQQIVDSFDRETSDLILVSLARLIRSLIRTSDVPARLEGNDFLIVLPNHNLQSAKILAERIRQAVQHRPMAGSDNEIPVTLSLGIADDEGKADLEALCEAAIRALALAKQGGHNRIASLAGAPLHFSSAGVEE